MTSPAVRPARLADAERLGAVHVQSWREAYAGLLSPEQLAALDPGERSAMWRGQLLSGLARGVAVAEDGGDLIGFASCTRQRSPVLKTVGYGGEVAALYVLRSAQSRGAGRLLMRAMARRLIAEGERAMALWVLAGNAPARGFYERLGGTLLDAQAAEHGGEVAYGWRDLATLAQHG